MVVIEKQQFCIDIGNYAMQYAASLRSNLIKASTYIDTAYVDDLLANIGNFAALIRPECMTDMAMLHEDTGRAQLLKEQYGDFGQYCYDVLLSASKATNASLLANNALCRKLQDKLSLQSTDVVVSTNYIAFNLFGKGGILELTNFKRVTGIGLLYDIRFKMPAVETTNVQESVDSKLAVIHDFADVISNLQNRTQVFNDIDEWSVEVNDKLVDAKLMAEPAWLAAYKAYEALWQNLELTKQNVNAFCNLANVRGKLLETIFKSGSVRRFDYHQDYVKILQLDYLNSANFDFR